MKRTTIYVMMLISICTISLTSCLGSDDNEETSMITPEEVRQALQMMNGNYSGKLLMDYQKSPQNSQTDRDSVLSTNVTVSAADTLLNVEFPVKLLANVIMGNDDLKEAVKATGTQPYKIQLYFAKSNESDMILFYPMPLQELKFNVNYGEVPHEVTVSFASTLSHAYYTFYAQGEYIKSNSTLAFYILPYKMTVDGKMVTTTTSPMLYIGTKK